jgi:Tfp pilus assembly protein PilO
MPRSFKLPRIAWPPRNASAALRLALITLLVLNLVAGWFVWHPPGGSPAELDEQMVNLRAQLLQRRLILERTRRNVSKVETGRSQGDSFLENYFLGERTAYSSLLGELVAAAKDSKVTPKEHSFSMEPIDGSDTLAMLTIAGNYEGTYADLMQFINRLDRSSRLLIIESLNATPQQSGAKLNVNIKLDAFVRQQPPQEAAGQ